MASMVEKDGQDDAFAGFEVVPLTSSPMLHAIASEPPSRENFILELACESCGFQGDCMLNLGDNKVFCGRHANGCMMRHCQSSPCPIVISFLDLSIWDYCQDAYLDMYNILEIQPHYSFLHQIKFGEPAVLPNLRAKSDSFTGGISAADAPFSIVLEMAEPSAEPESENLNAASLPPQVSPPSPSAPTALPNTDGTPKLCKTERLPDSTKF